MSSEIFPSVRIRRELAEVVDDVDVNLDGVTEYMHQKGFDDSQIEATTIEVSHLMPVSHKNIPENKQAGQIYGAYDPGQSTIYLYPYHWMQAVQNFLRDESDNYEADYAANAVNASQYFSGALAHEITHHEINQLLGGVPYREKLLHTGKTLARALGVFAVELDSVQQHQYNILPTTANRLVSIGSAALSANKILNSPNYQYRRYLSSPEEVRCNEAQANAPTDLVTLKPKSK